LQKILNLINKLKRDDEGNRALSENAYASLSLREKFTYNMIHLESSDQNCDGMPEIQDEQKKIFGYLTDDDYEGEEVFTWSDRQRNFFADNRDSVIKLMSESIQRTKRIGVNYKEVIIEIHANEMIPLLISTYKISKKDRDILTVLMSLMRDGKYEPFLSSTSYKKLYGDESNYQSYISYNPANEDLIIKRATDFYNGLHK
jgi:hypothetical protein